MNKCWQCGAELESALICSSCNSLQPPATEYFAFFGLPQKLTIDTESLQAKFYELSRQLHPDRYSRKSERERTYSTTATAILNDAWRTLRNPVSRAEYLLTLSGLEISEQRTKDVPPDLLEEVFELNMALEELRDGDASARDGLLEARGKFDGMLRGSDTQLQQLFEQYDAGTPEALPAIRGVLNKRRYISNLLRDVDKELS